MDEKWHFDRDWEKMKTRVDKLEREVYWLSKFMNDHEYDIWLFNYLWEKMQKRIDDLENKVKRLEHFKKEQIEKEYKQNNGRKN